jgi:hypothetical protein
MEARTEDEGSEDEEIELDIEAGIELEETEELWSIERGEGGRVRREAGRRIEVEAEVELEVKQEQKQWEKRELKLQWERELKQLWLQIKGWKRRER